MPKPGWTDTLGECFKVRLEFEVERAGWDAADAVSEVFAWFEEHGHRLALAPVEGSASIRVQTQKKPAGG